MKGKCKIHLTVAKCKIYPDGGSLVCISPKSNDYMCTKKTYLFPLPLMALPTALSSPVITTFNFIHGSLLQHRLYEQHGSGTSHSPFHYSLFSFSMRDSFLSGSHLESIECLFPAGQCERAACGGLGRVLWGRQRWGYGNLANRADKKGCLYTNCLHFLLIGITACFVDRGCLFIHAEISVHPNT